MTLMVVAAFYLCGYIYTQLTKEAPRPKADEIELKMVYPCDTVHLDRATTYQPTESQCDSNPLTTADGSKINPNYYQKWVALSRDLIYDEERQKLFSDTTHWRGRFRFGDTLDIYSAKNPNLNGQWVVRDVMAARYKNSIDFLLEPEKNYPKLGVGKDVKIIYCGYED